MKSDAGEMTEQEGQAYLAHVKVAQIVRDALPRIVTVGVVAGVVCWLLNDGVWGTVVAFLILAVWTTPPMYQMFEALDRMAVLPEGHPLNQQIPTRILLAIPGTAVVTCLVAMIVTDMIVGS